MFQIVYDEARKKWVNKNATEEELDTPLAPPPKMPGAMPSGLPGGSGTYYINSDITLFKKHLAF